MRVLFVDKYEAFNANNWFSLYSHSITSSRHFSLIFLSRTRGLERKLEKDWIRLEGRGLVVD